MNAWMERALTGIVAAAAFPLVLIGLLRWLGELPEFEWSGWILMTLYAVPVFLTIGTAASILVDAFVDRIAGQKRAGGALVWLRTYVTALLAYAAAGFAAFAALSYALFGRLPTDTVATQAALMGVPAALVYFHVSKGIRTLSVRAYEERNGAPVETDRLLLVPCTLERYEQAAADGYPIGNHVNSYIESLRRQPGWLGWGVWLVQLKETGEWIGDAGFKGNPDFSGAVDLGYGFLPEHWGQGYATEAAGALVAWAFEHGAGRVTAETLRDNAASIRVLRKSGFRLYREDEHYYWRIDAVDRLRQV